MGAVERGEVGNGGEEGSRWVDRSEPWSGSESDGAVMEPNVRLDSSNWVWVDPSQGPGAEGGEGGAQV